MPEIPHKPPALIFDFGGVLLDWNPRYLYRKLFHDDEQAVESFLREIDFFRWNYEQDKGRSYAEAVPELCSRFPQYADLIRAYDERYEESIGGVIQPTVEILAGLKQRGYPLFGLSNIPAEKYRIVRKKYEFMTWFEDIVASGEVKLAKPDPRIFGVLLEQTHCKASDCIYIDDSGENIRVADHLGFETIRFESSDQLRISLCGFGIEI